MSSLSKLQSDVLEQKYGSIYAEVLTHSKHIREVFLLDQKRIKREYAVTFFPDKVDRALLQVNKKIKNGGLIGKTFRDNGYNIIKRKKKNFQLIKCQPSRVSTNFVLKRAASR